MLLLFQTIRVERVHFLQTLCIRFVHSLETRFMGSWFVCHPKRVNFEILQYNTHIMTKIFFSNCILFKLHCEDSNLQTSIFERSFFIASKAILSFSYPFAVDFKSACFFFSSPSSCFILKNTH